MARNKLSDLAERERREQALKFVAKGSEPSWTKQYNNPQDLENDVAHALQWYNVQGDKDSRKNNRKLWLVQYLRREKLLDKLAIVEKLDSDVFLTHNTGQLARMLLLGIPKPEWKEKILRDIPKLVEYDQYLQVQSEKERLKRSSTPQPKLIDGPALEVIDLVETHLNKVLSGTDFKPFSFASECKARNISPKVARLIAGRYYKTLQEMSWSLYHPDSPSYEPEFEEAYGCYTKEQRERGIQFLKSINLDCTKLKPLSKQKKRKEKPKSAFQLVMKLLLLQEAKIGSKTYRSLDKEKIIGSDTIWIYNVSTRKLGRYVSLTDDGLTVKGTTIMNYDEDESVCKNLRHPEVQIPNLLSKRSVDEINQYFDSINSVPQKMKGRTNRDSLLLSVIS